MIIIPVFYRHFTATVEGSRLKFVPCESCSVEYVYVMDRDATGGDTSVYMLNDQGAAAHAASAAKETLASVLENDFDAVPCPACGHYQRSMFPKLLGNTGAWVRLVQLVVIVLGCLAAVSAAYRTITYFLRPAADAYLPLITAWSALLVLAVTAFGLSILNKVLIGRFNPNKGDPQARIALGRSRAVTREEFEKAQEILTSRFHPDAGAPQTLTTADAPTEGTQLGVLKQDGLTEAER